MKVITLHAIRETLHNPRNLQTWADSAGVDQRFTPKKLHGKIRAGGTIPLVSTSLFNLTDKVRMPAKVTYDWFNRNVLAGPPGKYYEPLLRRHRYYSGFADVSHRVYIPGNFEELAPWLHDEIGFDEVVIMSVDRAGMLPGMLWRYLPISDQKLLWVACTGIDESGLEVLAPKLCQPGSLASVSIASERWFLPFAGPAAFSPVYLRGIDMPTAMSAFLHASKYTKPDTFFGQVLERTRGGAQSRFCDAAFLSLAFWNRMFLRSEAQFFSTGGMQFGRVEVNGLNFGAPNC